MLDAVLGGANNKGTLYLPTSPDARKIHPRKICTTTRKNEGQQVRAGWQGQSWGLQEGGASAEVSQAGAQDVLGLELERQGVEQCSPLGVMEWRRP